MINECQDYLNGLLKKSGYSRVINRKKELVECSESKIGACFPAEEEINPKHRETIYLNNKGTKIKRKQKFERKITFDIVISEYDLNKVESMYEKFLMELDSGITVDGNYVPLAIKNVEWISKEDNILKANQSVHLQIEFETGIYKESGFASLNDLHIEADKENQDG